MTQNRLLLALGVVLLAVGILKPDLSNIWPIINNTPVIATTESYVTTPPKDAALLEQAKNLVTVLSAFNDPDKKLDFLKLSSLYHDLAILISLDEENMVIKNTASIREANSLSGTMLRLNLKDKYEKLAELNSALVTTGIGNDDVMLDTNQRQKAVEVFEALSWAYYEGSQ
jgi:hypothetical protein